ncbi:MAG: NADH-quinone oxidoreductase subunit J [Desulfarculus sp.]|nr:NADH-quinone oxidoreductase subunit J [Desulfarculus sp.]
MGQYIRPEAVAWAAFILVVGLTFAGALIAVLPRNIIYNVFGLATCILGVAGLFIFLGSEFLAMMEILIYIGAISIAIVFAIMLSQPMHVRIPPAWRPKLYLSFAVSAVVFVSFSVIVLRTPWAVALERSQDWTVKRLGELFLTRYELLFELISLALLVAIIGAIITAAALGGGRKPEGEP